MGLVVGAWKLGRREPWRCVDEVVAGIDFWLSGGVVLAIVVEQLSVTLICGQDSRGEMKVGCASSTILETCQAE
jgi:hypothetical protein